MKNIINNIIQHTPTYCDKHYYIKTQKIYIPFSKLTIHCIEKDIFQLDPIFESVMLLIAEGMTELKHIADTLGMSDDVFNEAVVDMAHGDYVYISAGTIDLTDKGRSALKENSRIERKRIELPNVFSDLITGKVYDANIICANPRGWYVPLEPVVNIDDEYFSEHFKEIKNLHKLRQKQYQINENAPVEKELEKIIGAEQSIVYVEKELYIYKNTETGELYFKLNDDDGEDSYTTQLYKQLNQGPMTDKQLHFFEMINKKNVSYCCFTPDPSLLKQTESIRQLLHSNVDYDEKEEAFFQKHYALHDREYVSYITNSSRFFKFDYILIVCSDDINTLLSDSLCSQLKTISENIPVFIVYNGNDERSKNSISYFFQEKESFKKLCLLSKEDLDIKLGEQVNYICYYPMMIANITNYTTVTEFKNKDDSPREIAYSVQIYDFDKKMVETTAKKIIKICPEIQECLEKPLPKKVVFQKKKGRNIKSSNFSKSNKTRAGYRKKPPKRPQRDKQ
ncbi:MAG: hypothetical protein J1F11_05270 [Oscillospiraceae bacterium]|nr:hypothetical protein [Oscillospiraceae bacterium]